MKEQGLKIENHKIGRRRIERFKRGLKGLENARGNSTTGGDEITTCKDWRNTAREIPAIKGHLLCFRFFARSSPARDVGFIPKSARHTFLKWNLLIQAHGTLMISCSKSLLS